MSEKNRVPLFTRFTFDPETNLRCLYNVETEEIEIEHRAIAILGSYLEWMGFISSGSTVCCHPAEGLDGLIETIPFGVFVQFMPKKDLPMLKILERKMVLCGRLFVGRGGSFVQPPPDWLETVKDDDRWEAFLEKTQPLREKLLGRGEDREPKTPSHL